LADENERGESGESRRTAGPRRQSAPRGGGRGYGRSQRQWRRRVRRCYFCVGEFKKVDYKDADTLRRFLNDRGKIRPRRQTGTCARHQRRLAQAIKRARHLALLPFTGGHIHGQ
jgi:small subunit ribosomal protein S18